MPKEEFNPKELKNIQKIGVKYNDSEGKTRIIDTDIVFVSDNNITLSSDEKGLNLEPPQIVSLKYILDNVLCSADTILDSKKNANGLTYLVIDKPKTVTKINRRKYYRINMNRSCVLVATDINGNMQSFLAHLINISLGGLLIHELESMESNGYVNVELSDYQYFNIILFLDVNVVLKLTARYLRQEKGRFSNRYAFEFTNIKKDSIEIIGKYITQEQIKQRNKQKESSD